MAERAARKYPYPGDIGREQFKQIRLPYQVLGRTRVRGNQGDWEIQQSPAPRTAQERHQDAFTALAPANIYIYMNQRLLLAEARL